MKDHSLKYLIIAMESTGFYGVHIANYLSTCEKLAAFSTHVYCLNPKEIKGYKKSFNSLDKNDGIDSFVIADFARVGRISVKPWRGSPPRGRGGSRRLVMALWWLPPPPTVRIQRINIVPIHI